MVTVTRVNVAKGKQINNTADFAKVFDTLNVDQKTAVIKNLREGINTGKSPSGLKFKDNQKPALEQLLRWATVNLLVGHELCPPDNLSKY